MTDEKYKFFRALGGCGGWTETTEDQKIYTAYLDAEYVSGYSDKTSDEAMEAALDAWERRVVMEYRIEVR